MFPLYILQTVIQINPHCLFQASWDVISGQCARDVLIDFSEHSKDPMYCSFLILVM
jgi:hypothetical protein